jgi:hypothetical protein
MLETLSASCEADGCDRDLTDDDRAIVFETDAGVRHVYECDCGAVTVTVARA